MIIISLVSIQRHSKSLVLGARLSFYRILSDILTDAIYSQIEGKKTTKKGIENCRLFIICFKFYDWFYLICYSMYASNIVRSQYRNIVISFFNSQASKVKKNNKPTHTHSHTALKQETHTHTHWNALLHIPVSVCLALSISHSLNHSLPLHLRSHTHSTRSLTHCLIEQLCLSLSLSHTRAFACARSHTL